MYKALIKAINDMYYPGDRVGAIILVFTVCAIMPLSLLMVFIWTLLKGLGYIV